MKSFFLEGLHEKSVVAQAGQFENRQRPAQTFQVRRLYFLLILLGAAFWLIVYRLFDLQIIRGRENLFWAEENFLYWHPLPSPRGIISSADGEVLARNKPSLSVVLLGSQLSLAQRPRLVAVLSEVLAKSEEELVEKYQLALTRPAEPVVVKENLSQEEQVQIKTMLPQFPGLLVEDDQVRVYPAGKAFSAVLGYTDLISPEELKSPEFADYSLNSRVGREGLERTYEAYLRPRFGQRLIEVDVQGGARRVLRDKGGKSGQNLVLSLQADWQKAVYEKLATAREKYAATGAVFVAMEVQTGRILSLVTLPTYDNNFVKAKLLQMPPGGGKEAVLFNRAIAGLYPPGSTIKPVVGAAALQEGEITPDTRISDSPQVIRIGPWEFPDWTVAWGKGAHGRLNVKEAIAESCDIFFYKVGGGFTPQQGVNENIKGLGADKLKVYLKLFGLGEKSGVDLPGEAQGLVPDPIWKEETKGEAWFLGNTYHLSIGQGDLLATPLQMLNLTNTIASGGKLLRPHLVDRIEDDSGNVVAKFVSPEVVHQDFIHPEYMRIIQEGMREAVSDGIVYPLRKARVAVAAKTGTAEFGTPNAKGQYKTHAWVTGFAPYGDPQVSFVLLLESGGASSNAAEVAREILDEYFK